MNSYKGEHVYPDDVIDKFRSIADDEALKRHRVELAKFVAKSFAAAGDELKVLGTIGQDDKPISSMGGSDETVTVSILLRIANQLVSAGADLFSDGRHYGLQLLFDRWWRSNTLLVQWKREIRMVNAGFGVTASNGNHFLLQRN